MTGITNRLFSTIGKKYVVGLTGLGLVLFVILHLAGNLLLLLPEGTAFNLYSHKLYEMGPLLYAAEIGLLAVILTHAVMAISVTNTNRQARPQNYADWRTKGNGPNRTPKSGFASRYMIVTGILILVFLIIHLLQFRFGATLSDGYVQNIDGKEIRDLYRLVREVFSDPKNVIFYSGIMVFLGFHLRHGFWSMFQSLGLAFPKYTKPIYCLAWFVAVALAVGFLVIPVFLYFK